MNTDALIYLLTLFFIVLIPVVIVLSMVRAHNKNSKIRKIWSDFAINNELVSFSDKNEMLSTFNNNIKNFITERNWDYVNIKNVIVSKNYTHKPGNSGIYMMELTSGTGKNRTTYPITIANFPITATSENIYMTSSLVNSTHPLRNYVNDKQKYIAEGDLSKYFYFYMPDNEKVDSMQLFDPTVMGFILENLANCDIELKDDQLYVYIQRSVVKSQDIYKILKRGQKLAEMIEKISPEAKVDTLSHASEEKARLKNTSTIPTLVAMVVFIIIAPIISIKINGKSYFVFLFMIAMMMVAFIGFAKKSKLKKEYISRYGREALI